MERGRVVDIEIDHFKFQRVPDFKYLGVKLNRENKMSNEIKK